MFVSGEALIAAMPLVSVQTVVPFVGPAPGHGDVPGAEGNAVSVGIDGAALKKVTGALYTGVPSAVVTRTAKGLPSGNPTVPGWPSPSGFFTMYAICVTSVVFDGDNELKSLTSDWDNHVFGDLTVTPPDMAPDR